MVSPSDDANLRYAEAATIERRVTERRRKDHVRTWVLVLWLTITSVFWVGAIVALVEQGHHLDRVVHEQASGRAVAIDVLCASASGVVDAGRATIGNTVVGPPRFERNLERLGLSPLRLRRQQARETARAYGLSIAKRVEQATGHKGLARPDGTLDCSRLRKAAKVP